MNKLTAKISLKNIAIASVMAMFFISDRYLKSLALIFSDRPPLKLIGDFFSFNFTANYNLAFSLPLKEPLLSVLVISVILCLGFCVLYLINKKTEQMIIIFLTLILLGALSNIFDRLTYGYVIDYWELKYFTVFNLADIMITGGAGVLIIKNLKHK